MKKIFETLSAASKYANYDFYRTKTEILELLQYGRKNGLNNPDYCRILIEDSPKGYDYPIQIELYFSDGEQVKVIPKKFIVGHFSSIPSLIKKRMTADGNIIIRVENLLGLALSVNEKVEMPISFKSISSFDENINAISKTITIEDELFDYSVKYELMQNEHDIKTKVIRYADIVGIPTDILNVLITEGSCSFNIEDL